ncbi:hypothetical protein PC116_g22231 [Phytophthora cactorum]|uniref:Uncharacterized protein n=1 Tax=Phytophthora cactorum TaxID=29920 RepID=A0A8T1K0U8_9STRA|nr:hypothetical protein PC114_g9878 [Phytophthora cactorum]KAG2910717.1 hypothetical protein PC117_g19342 [Phytophthora cactorum]KAG4229436.1 hypothetical protein PC116_g22231 [Phytophthora cactorum]
MRLEDTLLCAIVGVEGGGVGMFHVDINADQSMRDLKNAIKTTRPATITCEGNNVQL